MSFVSIEFLLLFTGVIFGLLIFRKHLYKKFIILLASCVFYAYWDWRFLGLIALVTFFDYFISRYLANSESKSARKKMLVLSITLNLSILGIFKYFNFFVDNLNLIFSPFGFEYSGMEIILPVGISFYIFETISYVIDIYRRVAEPADSLLDYAVFVTFFPRLVAGPIMRAAHFLPQIKRQIALNIDNFVNGAHIFAQGLFKKIVVADRLAIMVDQIYASPSIYSSPTVWLAVFSYSIQIYFDFSGYSDMAIGLGKIMGFDLPLNFNLPYVSQSITEFWKRWHISLSTWLRDYLYIPLGGNRKGRARTYLNLLITMLLGGLWHGASWNFVVWGGLHGLYLSLERIFNYEQYVSRFKQSDISAWIRFLCTFVVISVTWVFFRSPSYATSLVILKKLAFISGETNIVWWYWPAMIAVFGTLVVGWFIAKRGQQVWALDYRKPQTIPFLIGEYLFIFVFSISNVSPFIYFQF